MTSSSANKQIVRAAGTVVFAILLGQLAGLIRGILVARAFIIRDWQYALEK